MTTAEERILQLAEKVRRFRSDGVDKGLSEQDTKAVLVEPLLELIGWDVHDPAQVTREDRPTERPVDYSLKIRGKPVVMVECKRLTNSLDGRKELEQALAYASAAGVQWSVLTNGCLLRIYNSLAPEVAEKKLLEEVNLTTVGQAGGVTPEEALHTLELISPQSIETGRVDRAWDRLYIGTAIVQVVRSMWSEPDPGLVNLVRQRMKQAGRAFSTNQMKEWLGVLDVKVRIKAGAGRTEQEPIAPGSGVTHTGARSRGVFSSEAGDFEPPELEQRLRGTLQRPGDLTPRIVCFLEILLSEDRAFKRQDVKARLFERGIGKDVGQAGQYLSNVSQFITKKSNPHLRQVVEFESGGTAGAKKDNYRLVPEYRSLVQSLVDEWRQRHGR